MEMFRLSQNKKISIFQLIRQISFQNRYCAKLRAWNKFNRWNQVLFIINLKQMQEGGSIKYNIDPYYKEGNVFERNEAYYNQVLTGTRRTTGNMQGSYRQSSLQRSNLNQPQQSRVSPNNIPSVRGAQSYRPEPFNSSVSNNKEYNDALETNYRLKGELDDLINGRTDFGLSENVVKLSHYNASQSDLVKIKEQEAEIHRLQKMIEENQGRTINFKKAVEQLSVRMNNIQSIDKEIYKTLQSSVNRDKQLLERASTALARGEKREEVARILQQIIA